MKIEDVIDLLYLPMDSDIVISALDSLGLNLPILDDSYITEGDVSTEKSDLGLEFTFKEISGETASQGSPLVFQSFVHEEYPHDLLYGIKRSDSYAVVKEKIGSSAAFGHKYLKSSRTWKLVREDGKPYAISIRFDKSMEQIVAFALYAFPPEDEAKKFVLNEADR